jgi:RNA polymerase sigma-70 factor (family 1)
MTVAAIKNGNENTFQEVFYSYHHKLYAFILSKTQSTFIAEEVTQLAFIKLWQYRTHLDEELSINIQLFRIAKTTLIDVLRKEAKKQTTCQLSFLKETASGDSLEAHIYHKELQKKLELAVNKLPLARRNVFKLSRFDGLSYKEIAERLSLSTKTVEHHIALALKQLRHFLTLLSLLLIIFS